MSDEHVDYVARSNAERAATRMDAHEVLCTERWNTAKDVWQRVEKSVNGLYSRIWAVAFVVFSSMLGLIGFLAARAFPPH